jgi:hypothetical protein
VSAYEPLKFSKLTFYFSFSDIPPVFHPEYGRFMLESTPGAPYTGALTDLLSVERNMQYRYFHSSLSILLRRVLK